MSEEDIKRILLTTGYTTQTDKDAIYLYIKELKEVIEKVREIIKTAVPKNNGDYMMVHDDNYKKLLQILDKGVKND